MLALLLGQDDVERRVPDRGGAAEAAYAGHRVLAVHEIEVAERPPDAVLVVLLREAVLLGDDEGPLEEAVWKHRRLADDHLVPAVEFLEAAIRRVLDVRVRDFSPDQFLGDAEVDLAMFHHERNIPEVLRDRRVVVDLVRIRYQEGDARHVDETTCLARVIRYRDRVSLSSVLISARHGPQVPTIRDRPCGARVRSCGIPSRP